MVMVGCRDEDCVPRDPERLRLAIPRLGGLGLLRGLRHVRLILVVTISESVPLADQLRREFWIGLAACFLPLGPIAIGLGLLLWAVALIAAVFSINERRERSWLGWLSITFMIITLAIAGVGYFLLVGAMHS